MSSPSPRPWYVKKRWAAPLALWLVVAYLLSAFPAGYAHGRGWLGYAAVRAAYRPLLGPLDSTPPGETAEYLFERGVDLSRTASN